MILPETRLSRIRTRLLLPLVVTQSRQYISLLLLVFLFMRAQGAPDAVMEHLSASSHSLRSLPITSRTKVTLPSLPLLFNCFYLCFFQQQSPHKTFSFPLLLSLHTAPIKLLPFSVLSCVSTKTRFFLHYKKKKTPSLKILMITKLKHKVLRRE